MQPGLVTRDNIAMLIDLYELTMAASYHEHRPDDLDPSFSDSQRKAASDPSRLSPSMGPLVTGEELIRELFTRAGNPVCHTIPGIEGAEGRVGPKLVMGTTGPQRLADPRYRGRAKTVKEYLIESILEPGAYLVPGYLDQTVSWWYGQKLMAGALEKIATYLQQITEESPSSQ